MKDRIARLESHLAHEKLSLKLNPNSEKQLEVIAKLEQRINELKNK